MVPCCSEAPTAPTASMGHSSQNCTDFQQRQQGQKIVGVVAVAATGLVPVGCCGCFGVVSKLFVQRIGVASGTIVFFSSVFGVFVGLVRLAASDCSASELINERASGCGLMMISRTPSSLLAVR